MVEYANIRRGQPTDQVTQWVNGNLVTVVFGDSCSSEMVNAQFAQIVANYPELRSINNYDTTCLTDSSAEALATHCPQLEEIRLNGCEEITDRGVTALARNCPSLIRIELFRCGISDVALESLAHHCPHLTQLHLGVCNLTDRGIVSLVTLDLKMIGLMGCSNLTDTAVKALATRCPNLVTVSLYGCEKITETAMFGLVICCPRLRKLDIEECEVHRAHKMASLFYNMPRVLPYVRWVVQQDPHMLDQLTQWQRYTVSNSMSQFLVSIYRPRFASLRIHRFWRDVCYNPVYRYARKKLGVVCQAD